MKSLWKFFTSLQLTVVLLALGTALVFFGTLAQVHEGLWNAQERWFRSLFVVRQQGDAWWMPPIFPGGYLLGWMLLINLVAAHIKRFHWTRKKIGIHLTHFGIILLLVGQLATDMFSRESHLSFREGETKNYSEAHRANELVFAIDAGNGQEKVVSIPETLVAKKGVITEDQLPFTVHVKDYSINGEVLSHSQVRDVVTRLTTALTTVESQFSTAEGIAPLAERDAEIPGRVAVWLAALNAVGEKDTNDFVAAAKRVAADPSREGKLREELKARFRSEMIMAFSREPDAAKRFAAQKAANNEQVDLNALKPASTQGDGQRAFAQPLPEAKDMERRNMPFTIVEIVPKNGQSLGTWLLHPWLHSQEFQVDGKTYRTELRSERYYHPFSVTLLKTTHEVYSGTITAATPQGIPKNFQSRVRINNPQTGEAREVDIYMNNPLRYAGLTFFQYQMGRDERHEVGTSTLQVVRNPSWLAPYFGCIVVGAGMTWQFLYHLIGFMRKRFTPEPSTGKKQKSRKKSASLAKA